jgi:acylphosphatase
MIRRTSYFAGHVQGVGFRYTARDVAADFAVKGFVRNLPDGRVELVAEGESAEIDRFLGALSERMEGFIKQRTGHDGPATSQFSDFDVRR